VTTEAANIERQRRRQAEFVTDEEQRLLEQFAEHQPVLVGDTQAANQTRPQPSSPTLKPFFNWLSGESAITW
jgi:hypothetical protein